MLEPLDSYDRFCERFKISKEDLYEFGLAETIYPPIDMVAKNWEELKRRIFNNETVFIRGYGRDAKGTYLYQSLYRQILGNENVKKDSTNNAAPRQIISRLTGYRSNINIYNYQVSHIFGKTKNLFLFEAPWNIALVPKIIDPFTGHETKGKWPVEYQSQFLAYSAKKYAQYIEEYNQIITSINLPERVKEHLSELKKSEGLSKEVLQFEKDVLIELSKIELTYKEERGGTK